MSDFYSLDDDDKAQRFHTLARAALPLWGFEGATITLIKQRENAVLRLDLSDGGRAAMRIHRAGYHTDAELRSELEWMKALDAHGVNTPRLIAAIDQSPFKTVSVPEIPESRQIDVLDWVEGSAAGSIEQGVADDAAARDNFHIIGTLLARMHNFAEQWAIPADFTRHAWDVDGLLGENPWWGRFWELRLLTPEQATRLQRARARARTELDAYGKGRDRYGLIHADALPENFLIDEAGRIRIIDFDDGGFGWHVFDFATALFFSIGQESFDDNLAAMTDGYRSHRELPPQFEQLLPLFLLLRGFTYLGWIHTRSETNTAREMGPIVVEGVMVLVDQYLLQ